MPKPNGDLELTWEDVAALMRLNPLAAEQLKNIVLNRQNAELRQRLSEAAGGIAEGAQLAETEGDL